jgi:hypothetical protein
MPARRRLDAQVSTMYRPRGGLSESGRCHRSCIQSCPRVRIIGRHGRFTPLLRDLHLVVLNCSNTGGHPGVCKLHSPSYVFLSFDSRCAGIGSVFLDHTRYPSRQLSKQAKPSR